MPDATTLVMTGRLEDFGLADVLQVVGLSRQYTSIELRRGDGRLYGTIWVKSGRVIGAQRDSVHGRAAFYEMFGPTPDMFVVSRLPEPTAYSAPLGSLASLVMEAVERARDVNVPEPTPLPKEATARGSQVIPLPVAAAAPARKITSARPRPLPPPPSGAATLEATAVSGPPSTMPTPTVVPRTKPPTAPPPPRHAKGSEAPPQSTRALATPPSGLDKDWDESSRTIVGAPVGPEGLAIAVCSPKGGVGKTTITLNLALALAQRGRRTIAIDADINGDLVSLLAARDRVSRGAYDILDRPDEIDEVLRDTAVCGLRILPASGSAVPRAATDRRSLAAEWRELINRARERADLVLIDCPAGVFDVTADVLSACTHVVGVQQSDMVASRSASMLERGLAALPADRRPQLIGIVINMFQGRVPASIEAFQHIATQHALQTLFETTIPRSDAFAAASLAGLPLRFADHQGRSSPIAWLFEALASEVCDRTGLTAPATAPATTRFLL